MQSPFKFWSSAVYYRHLILVPRTTCKLLVGNDGWEFKEKKFFSVWSGEKEIHKIEPVSPIY
jgi:hypothetical protein